MKNNILLSLILVLIYHNLRTQTSVTGSSSKDTMLVNTNNKWFDKSQFLIVGTGVDYKNFDIVFKNLKDNLSRNVLASAGNIYDWRFTPILNQSNASVFVATKFGSFSYSKAIRPNSNVNFTKASEFAIFIPYKKLELGIDYLKLKGLNRTDPVYNKEVFLQNMTYNPIWISLEYHFERLKNNLHYVPRKAKATVSLITIAKKLTIKNESDFIPVLKYKTTTADSIIEIKNAFVKQFNSSGFTLAIKMELVLPLLKNKTKTKILYIKAYSQTGYTHQKFEYISVSDSLNGDYRFGKRKGTGSTPNLMIAGTLIYDNGLFLIGLGASYNQRSYGASESGNRVLDTRTNYNAFFGYRLNAIKIYSKIDAFTAKF